MKKFSIFLFLIFLLCIITADLFFYSKSSYKTIQTNYYLLFHNKLNITSIEKHYSQPFIRIFHGIYSDDFYIDKAEYNLLNKTLKINNSYFTDKFIQKIFKASDDLKFIKIPFKNIKLLQTSFSTNRTVYCKSFGNIVIGENIKINISSFVNNKFLNLKGYMDLKQNLNLSISYNNISLKYLSNIFDFPVPKNLIMENIKGKILLKGNLNSKLDKKISLIYNNIKVETDLNYFDESINIKKGKFFWDNDNIIYFTGKIVTPKIYNLNFSSQKKISGKFKNISFENIKMDLLINRDFNSNKINLHVKGNKITIDNTSFVKNNIINGNYLISVKNLNINNENINNLDSAINISDTGLNIKKLNFLIGEGKFLLSLIKGKTFQIATDLKHVNIKTLFQINNIIPNFNGKLNVTFLSEGKNNKFSSGKGYFFVENFKIYNISLDNLIENIKNNNIINLPLIVKNNESDNKSIDFELVKGFINPKGKFLNFSKVSFTGKNYYFTLNGKVNLKNGNNIILNGQFSYNDFKTDVIVNINLEKNLLQIIGKK